LAPDFATAIGVLPARNRQRIDPPQHPDLQPQRNIIGDAQVVAFGKPIHGGHEPLAMRNRLIRYGITQLGFTRRLTFVS